MEPCNKSVAELLSSPQFEHESYESFPGSGGLWEVVEILREDTKYITGDALYKSNNWSHMIACRRPAKTQLHRALVKIDERRIRKSFVMLMAPDGTMLSEPTKDEVAEISVAPEKQGAELFRLMQLLPLGGHWGTEIRPYREAGGDYLIWHVDDPVRRAAGGEELWPGDELMLKFLRSIAQNREGSLPLVEVVLTTLEVDQERQPIPVLELRYLRDRPNRSPVIGRTPLVANGRNYVPGYLQTVNGFAGAAGMIEASGYVLLNCDNVEDLDNSWRKLGMRLLTSARIEL